MEPNQPANPIISKKPFNFKQIPIYVLLVLISVGGTFFVLKKTSNIEKPNETNQEKKIGNVFEKMTDDENKQDLTWEPISSTKKAYPYVDRDTRILKLWDVEDAKTIDTDLKVLWGGGASGLGNTDPLSSPDALYTAYADDATKALWILSHETLEKRKISPKDSEISYITDWSPDSRYIVYYVKGETFQYEGMGRYEGIVEFEEQEYRGFLAFDTKTGKTIELTPLTYAETFVDNTRLLAKESYQSERLVIFDIETFKADFGSLDESYSSLGALQFDFSGDGKNWAYTYSKNPTDDANIAYGAFPSKQEDMKLIDSGDWAEVQWPKISPDGTKLMYQKKYGNKFDGLPLNKIHIVDLKTKENSVLAEGGHGSWIDNNNIIVSRTVREKSPTADLIIINLVTKEEFVVSTQF